MEVNEKAGLRGWAKWEHIRDGQVIDVREVPNTISNVGKAEVAYLASVGVTGTHYTYQYIAIGTGTTAASSTDTALGTEITTSGGARAAGTVTSATTTTTSDTMQIAKTFTFTTSGTFAVTESAVFNSTTGGPMLCRQTFAAINVVSGDTLTVTWKVAVA